MKQEENKRKRKADLKKGFMEQEKELKTIKLKLLDNAVKDTVAIELAETVGTVKRVTFLLPYFVQRFLSYQ